jgi:hypothetical protein
MNDTINDVIKNSIRGDSTTFVVVGRSSDGHSMEVHSRVRPCDIEAIRAAINKNLDNLME